MTQSTLALARALIGLTQGTALYLLYQAYEAKAWPATDGLLFAPLLAIAVFVPLIVVAGLGNLRPRSLALWTVAATALCAGLAWYDIFRDPIAPSAVSGGVAAPRIVPADAWFALTVGLFIGHSLIVAGDADRKFIAGYARYFDVAWKQGFQFVLAATFVGVFWLILWLGAELFRLIRIDALAELIVRRWFWIPVTTAAFTCAIHVTDVRAGIVRGTRNLVLTLLSWLLPLMTAITVAFLIALLFTGLEPLWNTRRATFLLLATAAALIFLINHAYQDDDAETPIAAVVRYSISVAALALVPLIALAAYGVGLRIEQYGWTPSRIVAVACIVVACCYTLGYALAALRPAAAWRWIERTNVTTAFVILAVLLALFSPIADPARISVADQVARLESGKVTPAQFDFAFLRFGGARYGQQALERLKQKQDGPAAAEISSKASDALNARSRWQAQPVIRATPQSRTQNVTVIHPKGQALPEPFVQQDWHAAPSSGRLPHCLLGDARCEAVLVDLDGDGTAEILLFGLPSSGSWAFKLAADGKWSFLGTVLNVHCPGVRDALRRGDIVLAQPEWKALSVAGQRLHIQSSGCT
jgi:hypothetical protein